MPSSLDLTSSQLRSVVDVTPPCVGSHRAASSSRLHPSGERAVEARGEPPNRASTMPPPQRGMTPNPNRRHSSTSRPSMPKATAKGAPNRAHRRLLAASVSPRAISMATSLIGRPRPIHAAKGGVMLGACGRAAGGSGEPLSPSTRPPLVVRPGRPFHSKSPLYRGHLYRQRPSPRTAAAYSSVARHVVTRTPRRRLSHPFAARAIAKMVVAPNGKEPGRRHAEYTRHSVRAEPPVECMPKRASHRVMSLTRSTPEGVTAGRRRHVESPDHLISLRDGITR